MVIRRLFVVYLSSFSASRKASPSLHCQAAHEQHLCVFGRVSTRDVPHLPAGVPGRAED